MVCHNKEISMNIYVGNLSYEVTEEELKEAFEAFGQVETLREEVGSKKNFRFCKSDQYGAV
jgi:RNA recognition motif-containing protein